MATVSGEFSDVDPHFRLRETPLVVRGGRSLSFVAAVLDPNVKESSEIGGIGQLVVNLSQAGDRCHFVGRHCPRADFRPGCLIPRFPYNQFRGGNVFRFRRSMTTLSEKPKILLVGDSRENVEQTLSATSESHEVVVVQNPMRAMALLDPRAVRRRFRHRPVLPRSLRDRQAPAERADPGGHARRRRPAGKRQHDHLGQRPDARMERPRFGRRGQFLRGTGQSGDPGAGFLSLPHGLGDRPGNEFHAAEPGQSLFPGAGRPGPRVGGPGPAPDHHRPRRDPRGPAAAEAGRDPPGRHGAGRPDAGRSLPHADPRQDRASQVEHHPLHQGPAALRSGRDPPLGSQDEPPGTALGRGHGSRRGDRANCSPCPKATA